MRDVIEQGLGWAVVAGVVLAVLLGRKRGQDSRAAAIAQAHAQGFAEGGQAAAAAHAQQSVMVAVDNSRRDRDQRGLSDHSCADPWACLECGPVLARIALRGQRYLASGHDDDDTRGDDDDHGAGYYFDHSSTRAVPVGRVVPDQGRPGRLDGVVGGHGVRPPAQGGE